MLWTLNFSERVSRHQYFLLTLNLKLKFFLNFFIYRVLWTEFFRGGCGPIYFGHAKIETQNFFCNIFNYRVLQTLNFLEGVYLHKLFLVTLNLRSKMFQNFFIYRVLRTLNFSEGVSKHQHLCSH